MLITRETDYALRILRALADGKLHKMEQLCQSEKIPQQFAYKILKKLADAGLVQSTRGREGGCRLTADLGQVTLYDLMEAVEPERRISACLTEGYQCEWVGANQCACGMNRKLKDIQRTLDEELRAHTLKRLMEE